MTYQVARNFAQFWCTMPNHLARSCIPRLRSLMTVLRLGDNPGPTAYGDLRVKYPGHTPSVREVQEMLGSRYGLSKYNNCKSVLALLNSEARDIGLNAFSETEIVLFDSFIPNLGVIFAERTLRAGTDTTPLADLSAASNYSITVVESAIRKRLLPRYVCMAIASAAQDVFSVGLPSPLQLPEYDYSKRPPAVEDGRSEVIIRFRQSN